MPVIPFGAWRSDIVGRNSGVAVEISGVLPRVNGYGPWPGLSTTSDAVPAAVRGAVTTRSTANAVTIFAGTAVRLYKFVDPTTAWTNVTRSSGVNYALATDNYWQFAIFGDNVIAVQSADAPQYIGATSGTNFEPLAGSPPTARYIAIVGQHVMLGGLSTDEQAVRWSAYNDSAYWTIGNKRADIQSFPDGGWVQGLIVAEKGGLVFQQECVRRMYAGAEGTAVGFFRIGNSQGTRSPYSIIQAKGGAYYYATRGFYGIGLDGASVPIGSDFIDSWFRDNSNVDTRPRAIIGAYDPVHELVFWIFATSSNASSTTLDGIICYDPSQAESDYGPWSHATLDSEYIFSSATPGWTLTTLAADYATLTLVPYPMGADIWLAGSPGLAGFDSAHKLAFFSGGNLAALVRTAQFEPIPGRRAFVNGFRLHTDASAATGRINVTERPMTTGTWTAPGTLNGQGIIHNRASGRLMQVEASIAAGESWSDLQGISFDDDGLLQPDGEA